MKKTLFLSMLFGLALSASTAFAQTEVTGANGVTVERPEGWEDATGNDRAAFTFREATTNSQIEIISTPLLTAEVKDVFYNTFHEALKAANFLQQSQTEKTLGTHEGTETIYSFEHSGAALTVAIFEFVSGSTAWVVVSYMGSDSFDELRPAFEGVISSLKLSSN